MKRRLAIHRQRNRRKGALKLRHGWAHTNVSKSDNLDGDGGGWVCACVRVCVRACVRACDTVYINIGLFRSPQVPPTLNVGPTPDCKEMIYCLWIYLILIKVVIWSCFIILAILLSWGNLGQDGLSKRDNHFGYDGFALTNRTMLQKNILAINVLPAFYERMKCENNMYNILTSP